MSTRIFLAGATGAIGQPLLRLLAAAGHTVFGTTRSAGKAALIAATGATPLVVDVFDAAALQQAMLVARPDIVINQLTDLPPALAPALMPAALLRNARVRSEGTKNLVDAARASGARRMIAQSIAWVYAPGAEPRRPHGEDDAIAVQADGTHSASIAGVLALERLTLASPPMTGVVLRYGNLYGPGTGRDGAEGASPVHVDAAAQAALLAMTRGAGIYNVAEDNATVATEKARRELGWDAAFRNPA
jgi:nucleoside-diphosphate-sugar epimerase